MNRLAFTIHLLAKGILLTGGLSRDLILQGERCGTAPPARRDVVSFCGDSLSASRVGSRPPLPVCGHPLGSFGRCLVTRKFHGCNVDGMKQISRHLREPQAVTETSAPLSFPPGCRTAVGACHVRACAFLLGCMQGSLTGQPLAFLVIGLCSWPRPAQRGPGEHPCSGLSHSRKWMVWASGLGTFQCGSFCEELVVSAR